MMACAASNAASLAFDSARLADRKLNMASPGAGGNDQRAASAIDLDALNRGFQINLSKRATSNGHTLIVYRVGDMKQRLMAAGQAVFGWFDLGSFNYWNT